MCACMLFVASLLLVLSAYACPSCVLFVCSFCLSHALKITSPCVFVPSMVNWSFELLLVSSPLVTEHEYTPLSAGPTSLKVSNGSTSFGKSSCTVALSLRTNHMYVGGGRPSAVQLKLTVEFIMALIDTGCCIIFAGRAKNRKKVSL